MFSCGLAAGRAVDDHSGSGPGMGYAGRVHDPHVLTDLSGHHQLRKIHAPQQDPASKGNDPSVPFHGLRHIRPRRKVAQFIKFRIIGNVFLRDQGQQLSVMDRRSHIVKLSVLHPRKSHKEQNIVAFTPADQLFQHVRRRIHQDILVEQVSAGIARQAELREHHELCPVFLPLFDHIPDLGFIVNRVCHLYIWRSSRNADKTVFHFVTPFLSHSVTVQYTQPGYPRLSALSPLYTFFRKKGSWELSHEKVYDTLKRKPEMEINRYE